MAKMQIT